LHLATDPEQMENHDAEEYSVLHDAARKSGDDKEDVM
jgi:hypothetical protein